MRGEWWIVADDGRVVIEELHFIVDPAEREEFLEVEARIWTGFLRTCDGFLKKEVWVPLDDQQRVVVMIWWESMDQWKRITAEQVAAVDATMGRWLRDVDVFREYDVVRLDH